MLLNKDLIRWMDRRERQILVHSFLYYRMDENIVSDHSYDLWSHELADSIQDHESEFKQTAYYKDFIGFTGSTGMDLPLGSPEIERIALRLLAIHLKRH